MKIALALLASLAVAFLGITWLALEAGGVAIVETRAEDGSTRSTHVWFAEPDGELWLEAGSQKNRWFADLAHDPRLSFRNEGRAGAYTVERHDDPATRARIRALLREKYGLRDRWIQLFVDSSGSSAVRLVPAER